MLTPNLIRHTPRLSSKWQITSLKSSATEKSVKKRDGFCSRDLSDKIHEQKMDRDKRSQQNKLFYGGLGAAVITVILILTGKRLGGDKSDFDNKA